MLVMIKKLAADKRENRHRAFILRYIFIIDRYPVFPVKPTTALSVLHIGFTQNRKLIVQFYTCLARITKNRSVMTSRMNTKQAFYALSAVVLLASCQKNEEASTTGTSSASSTIAVATTATVSTSSTTARVADSVYLLQPCRRGEHRDTVAQADLPGAVATYLADNYNGASFSKAFVLKDQSGSLTGYVVVLYFNSKPVGLQFDSTGAFVKVLEQREKGDLNGAGWHHGGRFEHRDGKGRDTIALSALPASVTAYLAANYATDTLVKAFQGKDSSLVVLSKNNGLYATVFTATGSLISRVQSPAKQGRAQSIELAALPSAAANYLSQTYPNYVFEKAFSVSSNGAVQGYVVIIDANNTKYAVSFDASGNFLKAKTIR